jgi:hypothetical protein
MRKKAPPTAKTGASLWPQQLPPDRRSPELSGTVERVEPANEPGIRLLLRSARPGDRTYVIIREGVPIRWRGGDPAGLATGQTVSVWYSGGMYMSDPPGCYADAVVIETIER